MSKRLSELGGNPRGFARGMSLTFEFVGAIFLFWFGGRLLDDRFGTEPWLQVIGALIGWVGGFLHVYYHSKGEGWGDVPQRTTAPRTKGTTETNTNGKSTTGTENATDTGAPQSGALGEAAGDEGGGGQR